MQLRSANNALEFAIQQKDELIAKLKGDSVKWQEEAQGSALNDEQSIRMKAQINKLEIRLATLLEKNADLEEKCAELTASLRVAEEAAEGAKVTDTQAKMAEQIE
jgi:hypothetical protein